MEHLDQLENQEGVSEIERLKGQLLRCRIITQLDIKKAHEIATQVIQASQALDQPLIGVDAQLIMAEAWLELGMLDTSKNYLYQSKTQLATISIITSTGRIKREAMILANEGGFYFFKGDLDRAIECAQQSLMLREQQDDPQAIAHSFMYLGMAYYHIDQFERAIEFFQKSLTLREQLQHPLEIAQSLFHIGRCYFLKSEYDRALEYLQKSRAIYEELGIQHGLAHSLAWIGPIYGAKGELNQGLEILRGSLAICEQLGIPGTFAEARVYQYLGRLYMEKGELEYALDFYQKSLALQEARGFKSYVGWNLNWIGDVYRQKGQLDVAFEYYVKALKVHEEVGASYNIVAVLHPLVWISLELENLDSARYYSHRLDALHEKLPSTILDHVHVLTRALLLKASPRIRDKMQAQVLLRQIIEDDVIWMDSTINASFHLCELLFVEFKISEDPTILNEIKTVTNRLMDHATAQYAYSTLTKTYLLQAKLAILEQDVPRARHLFTQAQVIADEKGLELLARSISHEHDVLLAQLEQSPPPEVSELAGVEEFLERLVLQRALEPPELRPEAPVLLLILTEGGINIFSKKFALGRQLDEHRIGGLLTALSNFGKDVFSGSETNRIMYEEYTVVLKALDAFLFCYIFQGHSYLALQKLDQFIVRVRESAEMWKALITSAKTDSALKTVEARGAVEDSELHRLIIEIFASQSAEIPQGGGHGTTSGS